MMRMVETVQILATGLLVLITMLVFFNDDVDGDGDVSSDDGSSFCTNDANVHDDESGSDVARHCDYSSPDNSDVSDCDDVSDGASDCNGVTFDNCGDTSDHDSDQGDNGINGGDYYGADDGAVDGNVIPNSFSLLSWNIEGFFQKIAEADFIDFVHNFDIVCLVETFHSKTITSLDGFSDFICFSSPGIKLSRRGRCSGGVLVMIKKTYDVYVTEIETDCDHVVCIRLDKTLFGAENDVILVNCYCPPAKSPYYNKTQTQCHIESIEELLINFLLVNDSVSLLDCGDLNARTGNYQPNPENYNIDPDSLTDLNTDALISSRRSEDDYVNDFGTRLLSMCSCMDMIILNGMCTPELSHKFTYVSTTGNSTNDYILISSSFVHHCLSLDIQHRVESSHMPLKLALTVEHKVEVNPRENTLATKYIWDSNKRDQLAENIESPSFKTKMLLATAQIQASCDDALETFTNAILDSAACMKRNFNSKQSTNKVKCIWYDRECKQTKKITCKALRKYSKNRSHENKLAYTTKRNSYKSLLRRKEAQYKKEKVNNILENVHNSQEFWKEMKRYKPKNPVKNSISEYAWYDHFNNLLNDTNNLSETDIDYEEEGNGSEVNLDLLNSDITESEVREAISHAKTGKAAGPDLILNEFLKSSEDIIPFLLTFLNELFSNGSYPKEWCKGVIIPLFKKGNPEDPGNYRGITLLSCVSKIYTYILNARLTKWVEINNKISDCQAGFRKDYRTTDHIFTLYAIVQRQLLNKKKMYVAFVDFQKAFDTVNRGVLWNVLIKAGVRGKMLEAIKSMYACVKCCVLSATGYSDYFDCFQGLKQGCSASPTLFSFLINELASFIIANGVHGIQMSHDSIELFLLMFADDLSLLSFSPVGLQTQLSNLRNFSRVFGLKVNLDKTKIIVFRNGGYLSRREQWFYGQHQIEVVNAYRYLGLDFTTRLSLNNATENLTIKAKKCVVEICRMMWRLGCSSPTIFFKLFDARVVPMLLYAAEIWGVHNFNQVEKVHLFACKRFLNVSLHTPNYIVYGELNRYPILVLSAVRCISYWFRLCYLPRNRLASKAYHMLKALDERGKTTWVTHVKNLLCSTGFGFVWISQQVGNQKAFLNTFKQRLIDCFMQQWHEKISSRPRYTLYNSFKSALEPEKYFDVIYSKYVRNMYIRFRSGVTELKSNKFRYEQDVLIQACPLCNHIPEDEVHFLFYCPNYNSLRTKYLHNINLDFYRHHKLTILNSQNDETIVSLAKFIFYAFKLRKDASNSVHVP